MSACLLRLALVVARLDGVSLRSTASMMGRPPSVSEVRRSKSPTDAVVR